MRGTPLGIRLFTRPAVVVVLAATLWNGSADTPASNADWTRSPDHLTITDTAATTFFRPAYGNNARASGTIDYTYVASGDGQASVGLSVTAPATASGELGTDASSNDIGYRLDTGDIVFNNSLVLTAAVPSVDDVIRFIKSPTSVVIQRQVGGTGGFTTLATVTVTGTPMAGAAYPAAVGGSFAGSGTKLTINGASW